MASSRVPRTKIIPPPRGARTLTVPLSGCSTITLPTLARWPAPGKVISFDQSVLTFTWNEIASLFRTLYDLELTSEELDSLLTYTEYKPLRAARTT